MSYTSAGARLLRKYRTTKPENIVWTPEDGWHTPESLSNERIEREDDEK